jgi:hypothetical protein
MSENLNERKTDSADLFCKSLRKSIFRVGVFVVFVCACFIFAGCAKELTPYGRARQADTIEAYEEFIRTCPNDPRVRFARHRIAVLRSFEAYETGDVSLVNFESRIPNRSTTPTRTMNMQQGPWNLTAALPRSSRFTLDLYHGDTTPILHKLIIEQEGQRVTYTLQHGSGPGGYYMTVGVPFDSFRHLWQAVIASDIGMYQSSYGRMSSTSDYRGNFVIEVDTGTQRLSRMIRLEGVIYQDQNLRNLIRSMTEMHPQDHSMRFFR